MWGAAHNSEITVINVGGWCPITGEMTVAVPGPIAGAGLPGILFAGCPSRVVAQEAGGCCLIFSGKLV
jgi:hypothetical protein